MNDSAENTPLASNKFQQVLAEYLRRRDAGEPVDMESFCSAYPDLADALRSYALGEGFLQAAAGESRQSEIESDASRGAETIQPGAAQRTALAPNAQFGRYRIIRLLGEGAMGFVYLAEHTHLKREVALKVPKFNGLEPADFQQRFIREARAAAKIDHLNICRVYDADEINGTPCIAMEYIDGQALSRFVGTAEYKDQRRVAEVVCAIASGLAQAHQQGVLHRDLKPSNVLMKGDAVPCVTDFGLARTVEAGQESNLTHDGTILGTPAYMSPEQIEAKTNNIGPTTDVYSLGTVLYELLAERLPFQGAVLSILKQVLHDLPAPLSKIRRDVDPKLEDLCLQMLHKSPAKRPASMLEVVDRLQQWLRDSSPESKAATAKAKQARNRLEEMKAPILDLVQRGQFAAAVAALEKMLELKSPDATEYVAWAREKLTQVKRLPKQLKESMPVLLNTARDFIQRYDYAQAAQLLQEIPQDFRSEEVQQVLDEAIALQDEADLLLADLQECVRTKEYQGIEENLKRLLQIKPGSKFARELQAALQTYSRVPRKQRKYRHDDRGRLMPMGGNIWDNWLLWGTVCFVLVFGVMSWSIMIYLKSGQQTLAVEVDDAWLKSQGGQLTLSVDGRTHTLTGPGLDIKVALGERGFSVKNGDTVVHNPQTFTIEKAGRQVLRIDATGMRLGAATDDSSAGDIRAVASTLSIELDEILAFDMPDVPDPSQKIWQVSGLAISPENRNIYLSNGKRTWKFDLNANGERTEILHDDRNFATYDLAISPDGRTVACARPGGFVQLCDSSPWKETLRLVFTDTTGQCNSVRISADGKWIGAMTVRGQAAVWELETGRLVKEFAVQSDNPWNLRGSFTPDSREFHVAGPGDKVRNFYRLATETAELTVQQSETLAGEGPLIIGSADRALVTQGWNGPVFVADPVKWTRKSALPKVGNIEAVDWSPDCRLIATSVPAKNALAILDGETYASVRIHEVNGLDIERLCFSKDSQILVAAGTLNRTKNPPGKLAVRAWKLRTSDINNDTSRLPGAFTINASRTPLPDGPPGFVKALEGHKGATSAVAWSSDGRTLVTTSAIDGLTRVWDVKSGATRHQFKSAFGYSLAMHPNGKYVAIASPWQPKLLSISIYDINTGQKIAETPEFEKPWLSADFSRDGKYLAVHCRMQGGIKVFDVSQLPKITLASELPGGDSGWAVSVGFLSDSNQLIASSTEPEYGIQLFDVASRTRIRSYQEKSNAMGTNAMPRITVHPDGKAFYVRSDKTCRLLGFNTTHEQESKNFAECANSAEYLPAGDYLACCRYTDHGVGVLVVLDARSGKLIWKAPVNTVEPTVLAVSPDGRYAALCGGVKDASRKLAREKPTPLEIWRLPQEVWPKLASGSGSINARLPASPKPQDTWRTASNFDLVWCPPGGFRMGSHETPLPDADETPVDVTLTQGLWVARHEVTQSQWKAVMGTEPWKGFQDHREGANHAASHVTWTESVEYCRKLTESERLAGSVPADWEFRLPTEAEWEYFARAGTTTRYFFGSDSKLLSEHAWWRDNADAKGEKYAHEVGKFKPNPWGLHDIHGNVYEWCRDTFNPRLPGGTDPLVSDPKNDNLVNRGGGWDGRDELAHTSSNRRWTPRSDRRNNLGLRVVLAKVKNHMADIPAGAPSPVASLAAAPPKPATPQHPSEKEIVTPYVILEDYSQQADRVDAIRKDDGGERGVSKGILYWKFGPKRKSFGPHLRFPQPALGDFELEAEVRLNDMIVWWSLPRIGTEKESYHFSTLFTPYGFAEVRNNFHRRDGDRWVETRSELIAKKTLANKGQGSWMKLRISRLGNEYHYFLNGKPFDKGVDRNPRQPGYGNLSDQVSFWLLPSTDGPSKFEMRSIKLRRL